MAVRLACAEHYPLVRSPDSVWLCLAQGFATHVRLHAKALRKRIVQHEGREQVQIRRDDFVKGRAENPWPEVFSLATACGIPESTLALPGSLGVESVCWSKR